MAGKHNGVDAKIRAKITALYRKSSFAHIHCIIHQHNLCSKVLKFDNVMKLVTKTVNISESMLLTTVSSANC